MEKQSLSDIYSSMGMKDCSVYVVPRIRSDYPESDYLFLLYKPLLNNSDYRILSLSVFGHYKFVMKSITSKNVILHYHWLEFQDIKSLLGMPWKLVCIMLFKLFGGKIVWTVHNLEPHDRKFLNLHLRIHRWMAGISDKIHIHAESTANLIKDKFNADVNKFCLLPHPSFPAQRIDRQESINYLNSSFGWQLASSRPIALIWGNISLYKNIEHLLNLITEQNLDVQVIIAGPIKKGQETLTERITLKCDEETDFYCNPSFIEEKDIPFFFGATDFCLFNFSQILTSGSVEMALSYNKDIIAPRTGSLTELSNSANAFLFSNEKELSTLIRSSIFTFYNE